MNKWIRIWAMVGVSICLGPLTHHQPEAAESYDFLDSKNLKRRNRKSYKRLANFFQDFFIPQESRKMNPGSPPYPPHRMDKDFRNCKSCHSPQTYKDSFFMGIRIPNIPKWLPTSPKSAHPMATGSCSICHLNQSQKLPFRPFYLEEIYSRKYKPKL